MTHPAEHKPHLPQIEDLEPPMPPEPDEVAQEVGLEDGVVPALITDDPEHDRIVDPEGGFRSSSGSPATAGVRAG